MINASTLYIFIICIRNQHWKKEYRKQDWKGLNIPIQIALLDHMNEEMASKA